MSGADWLSQNYRNFSRVVIRFFPEVEIPIKRSSINLTNKEAYAVHYTVTKHDGHLRTQRNCRKHSPSCSQMSGVFYHSVIHGLGLFICFMIEVMWRKTIKHVFSMFYTLIKHGFLTNQSAHRVLSIL